MCYKKSGQLYIFGSLFILSFHSGGSGTSIAFTSYITVSVKFCKITFLNNLYFVSFFYHLFICWCQKNKTGDIKQKLFILLFISRFFSLLSIFLSYLSLLLNSNKASKMIFKTQFLTWEKSTLHRISQNLYNNNCPALIRLFFMLVTAFGCNKIGAQKIKKTFFSMISSIF